MIKLKTKEFLGKTEEQFFLKDFIISKVYYHAPVSEDWHYHENYHLTLSLRGGTLESRKKWDTEMTPGKVLLYDKEEVHRNRHTLFPSKNLNIEIMNHFFVKNDLDTTCFKSSLTNQSTAQFQLLKIYNELRLNDSSTSDSIYLLLLSLFSGDKDKAYYQPDWVRLLEELLQDRWDEFITLKELSTELNLHPVTISKYFSRYFKCTLGAYLRTIKIKKAISFLHQTNLSLTEIAYTCGFSDQSHFSRIFKELTGFTPKEYQKM